jgi:DNA-binding LacI/PurR family transcriptional regulator
MIPVARRPGHGTQAPVPTSYDVARHAGVSQSAVSRCYQDGGSLSAEKRARIVHAARELGWQPNAMASGLITRRSHLVAVVMAPHHTDVLAEMSRRLSERELAPLLFMPDEDGDMPDRIWRYRVDGAIVAMRLSDAQIAAFAHRRIPLVLYDQDDRRDGRMVSRVCGDSTGGQPVSYMARAAVAMLVDRIADPTLPHEVRRF